MKQKISPLYATIAIVAILSVAALTYWQIERSAAQDARINATAGMPPQVSEVLKKRMGGIQPPAQP